jgi:hypothetical protein
MSETIMLKPCLFQRYDSIRDNYSNPSQIVWQNGQFH